MADNAFVSWVIRGHPWELEDNLIASLDLPLNLEGNSGDLFHPALTEGEPYAWQRPTPAAVPNPGVGGR